MPSAPDDAGAQGVSALSTPRVRRASRTGLTGTVAGPTAKGTTGCATDASCGFSASGGFGWREPPRSAPSARRPTRPPCDQNPPRKQDAERPQACQRPSRQAPTAFLRPMGAACEPLFVERGTRPLRRRRFRKGRRLRCRRCGRRKGRGLVALRLRGGLGPVGRRSLDRLQFDGRLGLGSALLRSRALARSTADAETGEAAAQRTGLLARRGGLVPLRRGRRLDAQRVGQAERPGVLPAIGRILLRTRGEGFGRIVA